MDENVRRNFWKLGTIYTEVAKKKHDEVVRKKLDQVREKKIKRNKPLDKDPNNGKSRSLFFLF